MNRKTMVYALAWISALSFLSLGTSVFAENFDAYELLCEGATIATFDTKISINYLSQENLSDGAILERKNTNITWNIDAAQREVDKSWNITPKGAKKNKNLGKLYLSHREAEGWKKSIAKQYTAYEDNGLKHYLVQFGKVDVQWSEGEGAYDYFLDGNLVHSLQLQDHYLYHPQLKKLYAFSPLSEIQYTTDGNTVNSSYQYHAWLVECTLKKNGEPLGEPSVNTPKVETPALEIPKAEPFKEEFPTLETIPTSVEEKTFIATPIIWEHSVMELANMNYETTKKDYFAIKNQPLFVVVKNFGLEFKKERKALADYFGIKNYVGSYAQNMKIKNELLKLITVK